jgi:hypothetical protein
MKYKYFVTISNVFTSKQTPAQYCASLLDLINQDPLPETIHFYEEFDGEKGYANLLKTPCEEGRGHCLLSIVFDEADPHLLSEKDKIKRFYKLNKTMDIAYIADKHINAITGVSGIYPDHGEDLPQDWSKLSPEAMVSGAFAFYDPDSDDDNESTLSYSPIMDRDVKDLDIIDCELPL